MDLKPSKGLKVKVGANREVIFEDESLSVKKISLADKARTGVLTGATLAGYCEVEMPSLDGKKHWYPIDSLADEKGEKIVEEEVQVDIDDGDAAEDE